MRIVRTLVLIAVFGALGVVAGGVIGARATAAHVPRRAPTPPALGLPVVVANERDNPLSILAEGRQVGTVDAGSTFDGTVLSTPTPTRVAIEIRDAGGTVLFHDTASPGKPVRIAVTNVGIADLAAANDPDAGERYGMEDGR